MIFGKRDIKNVIYFNDSEQIHSKNKTIFDGNFPIGETKSFPLLGEHNLENLCAVLTIAKKLELDLDVVNNMELMEVDDVLVKLAPLYMMQNVLINI